MILLNSTLSFNMKTTSLTITDHLQNEYQVTEVIRVLPEEVELNILNLVTFNGDGINDGKDLCPGTPAGTEVGKKGCKQQVPLLPQEN